MTVVSRGTVRLRRAPACDPPYDDERPTEWWGAAPAQQPLQLELPAPRDRRTRPPTRPEPREAPQPAASADATAAAHRFMNTCLEILNGYRPAAHIRALSRPLEAASVLSAVTHAVR